MNQIREVLVPCSVSQGPQPGTTKLTTLTKKKASLHARVFFVLFVLFVVTGRLNRP
jgi:hypothetical protein